MGTSKEPGGSTSFVLRVSLPSDDEVVAAFCQAQPRRGMSAAIRQLIHMFYNSYGAAGVVDTALARASLDPVQTLAQAPAQVPVPAQPQPQPAQWPGPPAAEPEVSPPPAGVPIQAQPIGQTHPSPPVPQAPLAAEPVPPVAPAPAQQPPQPQQVQPGSDRRSPDDIFQGR